MEGLLPFKFEGKGITREWFTLENRQLARHPPSKCVGASAWDGQRVVASAPLVLVDLETGQRLARHSYVLVYPPIALKPIADLIENLQPVIQGDAVAPLALASKLQGRFRLLGLQGFTRDSHGSDRHCGLGCSGKVSWVVAH